jgi:carboxylesterase type B
MLPLLTTSIDGGFLQVGNANDGNPTVLLSETPFKAIIVKPGYRLNIFGFLASQELLTDPSNTEKTVGNLGFWDLRLALEWTHKNISYFNGDPSNITIGGYSAGAHAAFYQLAHDLEYAPAKRIIKRVVMQSNGPGVQPKSLDEAQQQFNELVKALSIPHSIPAAEKIERLRALDNKQLLDIIPKLKFHQFRAVTDGTFVRHSLFSDIVNGEFARKMRKSNVRLLTGECSDEHFVYGRYLPPAETFDNVVIRLQADYPQRVVTALAKHYFPGGKLPAEYKSWQEAFGKIYADVQIHVTQRGFLDSFLQCGAGDLVQRYRIEWRSKLADRTSPRSWGATHGADQILWFLGNGQRLDGKETQIARDGLVDQFAAFVIGEITDWGSNGCRQVRRLESSGVVDVWQDESWDDKLTVWRTLMDATLNIKASL